MLVRMRTYFFNEDLSSEAVFDAPSYNEAFELFRAFRGLITVVSLDQTEEFMKNVLTGNKYHLENESDSNAILKGDTMGNEPKDLNDEEVDVVKELSIEKEDLVKALKGDDLKKDVKFDDLKIDKDRPVTLREYDAAQQIKTIKEMDTRFTYHPPKGNQPDKYELIRSRAREFAEILNVSCPSCREHSTAITKLEECVMWANAAIARREWLC